MSLKIRLPKYDLPVKRITPILLNVNDLLPHEEIVSERLNSVMQSIMKMQAVDMPIIASPIPGTKKYLIVDGHHRWAALKRLGASKIPAIIIDYFDPSVKVYTWYPATDRPPIFIANIAKSVHLRALQCSHDPGKLKPRDLDGRAFIVLGNDSCFEVPGGIDEQKAILKELDRLNLKGLISLAWYGLLEDALQDLEKSEVLSVLVRRPLSKKEIMSIVKNGGVLPPKTTRHVLPYIPAKTYTPLRILL